MNRNTIKKIVISTVSLIAFIILIFMVIHSFDNIKLYNDAIESNNRQIEIANNVFTGDVLEEALKLFEEAQNKLKGYINLETFFIVACIFMELILVALNLTIWFYDRIFLPDTPERIEARNQKRLDNQELKQQQRRKKLEAQKAKLETQKAEIEEKLNK